MMNEIYKYFEDNIYYSVSSGKANIYLENDDLFEFEKMLKELKSNYNKKEKIIHDIKFYIEQSDIKDMLWGKDILKIIEKN